MTSFLRSYNPLKETTRSTQQMCTVSKTYCTGSRWIPAERPIKVKHRTDSICRRQDSCNSQQSTDDMSCVGDLDSLLNCMLETKTQNRDQYEWKTEMMWSHKCVNKIGREENSKFVSSHSEKGSVVNQMTPTSHDTESCLPSWWKRKWVSFSSYVHSNLFRCVALIRQKKTSSLTRITSCHPASYYFLHTNTRVT